MNTPCKIIEVFMKAFLIFALNGALLNGLIKKNVHCQFFKALSKTSPIFALNASARNTRA